VVVNFFKLLLVVLVKILVVNTETPIIHLFDSNDHGIDCKVGYTGTSLSDGSHLFLLCRCESSFAFLKEESRTSVSRPTATLIVEAKADHPWKTSAVRAGRTDVAVPVRTATLLGRWTGCCSRSRFATTASLNISLKQLCLHLSHSEADGEV